jgi:RecB family exonuclease
LKSFSKNKEDNVKEVCFEKNEAGLKKNEEKVINSDDTLYLSASSIQTFLQCPKKYYFRHILNLKEKSTFSASYGIMVHAIFELMLTKYIDEFSQEKVFELSEILFNIPNDREKALEIGFDERLVKDVYELSKLDLYEMKENFVDAITSLGKSYFEERPENAVCETKFKFSIPELENVVFSGFIDLIAKYENGYRILDYKTGRDKTALKKLISDSGVEFLSEGGQSKGQFSAAKVKGYEYQVPLYYLACLNADELKDYREEIYDMGYQYVRPDYKNGGSKSDFIEAETVKKYKDKIIENIKKYVVDEIRSRTEFEACYNDFGCKYCSFGDICDIEKDSEDNNDT